MLQASARTLKIKTGVVTRLNKELASYERELQAQQARIARLEAAGEDSHTLRKQNEVLDETAAMIPDSRARLLVARDELRALVADLIAASPDDAESDEIAAAQEALNAVSEKLV